MLRRTLRMCCKPPGDATPAASARSSAFRAVREELAKIPALFRHDAISFGKFLTGEDATDKEKQSRANYQDLAQKSQAAYQDQLAKMSLRERVSHAAQELRGMFSTNASVVALVQHCTRSHMADVAAEQGIDVKNVEVVTEQAAVGENTHVVGYIDAPAASDEEVMAYAMRLQQACPAAKTHGGIEWRRKPGETEGGGGEPAVSTPSPADFSSSSSPTASSTAAAEQNQTARQEEERDYLGRPVKNKRTLSQDDFARPRRADSNLGDENLKFFTGFQKKKTDGGAAADSSSSSSSSTTTAAGRAAAIAGLAGASSISHGLTNPFPSSPPPQSGGTISGGNVAQEVRDEEEARKQEENQSSTAAAGDASGTGGGGWLETIWRGDGSGSFNDGDGGGGFGGDGGGGDGGD